MTRMDNPTASQNGVLFETRSGKYLELVPGNAVFRAHPDNATEIEKSVFDDVLLRCQLLDRHNVDWYFSSIRFIPLQGERP